MRLGVAHHFGWAVVVSASTDYTVVDRRRIELIEPGLPAAPIHHVGGPHEMHRTTEPLDDDALERLVDEVRTSVARATASALDELAAALSQSVVSMSVRSWPSDFPETVAIQRRAPYEARADSIMYCKTLVDAGRARGWDIHLYDAKRVEAEAARVLGARAGDVLYGPRVALGSPWAKDHRTALAATIMASHSGNDSSHAGA